MSKLKSNKETAVSFLKLASSGKVEEAFSQFVDLNFKHHNQYFKGDRQSLLQAMKENSLKMPNRTFDVKTVLEEGDQVIAYSSVQMHDTNMQIAVFHRMKFKNNKIIEMWDVGQPISKDSPNENGMF